jgi:hypothetical protein
VQKVTTKAKTLGAKIREKTIKLRK